MSKGITSVITIVILLLIGVSLAGSFFIWVSRTQTTFQNKTAETITEQSSNTAKLAKIENIVPQTRNITIRNAGTATIPTSQITVYVGNALQTGRWTDASGSQITEIQPQNVAIFSALFPSGSSCAGMDVRAISPGFPDGDKTVC